MVENEFVRGMKLEASNPHQPGQICAATITRIIDNLMWISLDGSPKVSLVTFKQMYKVTWMKDCSHVTKNSDNQTVLGGCMATNEGVLT